jgi:hypothetical protein
VEWIVDRILAFVRSFILKRLREGKAERELRQAGAAEAQAKGEADALEVEEQMDVELNKPRRPGNLADRVRSDDF